MTGKDEKYLDAALAVFLRYGVKKATMGDIAAAAGVSRQTLYATFASKEEVMIAGVHRMCQQIVREVTAAWEGAGTLGEKLDIYFRIGVLAPYDLLMQAPDADDMLNGFGSVGKDAVAETYRIKRDMLWDMLTPHGPGLAASGMTAEGMADLIKGASHGFTYIAEDRAHLESLLAGLRRVVLLAAGAAQN